MIHRPGSFHINPTEINAEYGIDFHIGNDTFNVRFDTVSDTLVIRKDYGNITIHLTGSVNKIEVS